MGTINGAAIAVAVPYGTTVTGLTPTVSHTGSSYTPTGAQDFTGPVTYTVTAADGSTQDYTVTVNAYFTSAAEMSAWLAAQPANTAATPYPAALSLNLGTDLAAGSDPLGALYAALQGKYVALDLSACTGNVAVTSQTVADARPNRDKLTSVVFPASLTAIGGYAFRDCTGLTSVVFPASLTSIGEYAFGYCTALTSVNLSACTSLTSIGDYTFRDCTGLTSVAFPASLTSIGDFAFFYCTVLTSADLSACTSLTSIGEYAFGYCTLTSVVFPVSLTSIGRYAFHSCTALTSVNLSAYPSLTSIGDFTFKDCTGLTSVVFPASLTSIGSYAFDGCTVLTEVRLGATPPATLGDDIFRDTGSSRTITIQFPTANPNPGWVSSNSSHWGTYSTATIAQGTY
jgi:hypothetical protein